VRVRLVLEGRLCESQACACGTVVRVRLVLEGRLCESQACACGTVVSQACASGKIV